MKAYELASFDFWTDLTQPKARLMHYEGPKYLVHNEKEGCIKGIGFPQNRYVTARCDDHGHVDSMLSKRTSTLATSDPWSHVLGTAVKEAYPEVVIYCFTHRIQIGEEERECPPYAFKLDATLRFNTTDGYVYSPTAVELATTAQLGTEVTHIHFKNMSLALDENATIKSVTTMRAELEKARDSLYLLSFQGGGGVSYPVSLLAF